MLHVPDLRSVALIDSVYDKHTIPKKKSNGFWIKCRNNACVYWIYGTLSTAEKKSF